MGGVTRENRNKLIEQVIEEKEKIDVFSPEIEDASA